MRRAIVAFALAAFLASPQLAAAQGNNVVAIPQRGPPADAATMRWRVRDLHLILDNPAKAYRVDEAMRELRTLRAALDTFPELVAERRTVLVDLALVGFKSQSLPLDETMATLQSVLASGDAVAPFYAANEHFMLGEMAKAARQYDLALAQYRTALELGRDAMGAEETIGVRRSIGFVLQEMGRTEEARDVNLATLVDAERVFGRDNWRHVSLISNLAENFRTLGDQAAADRMLERAESVSNDVALTEWMIFRRMTLAFDGRRYDDARRHADRRVRLLQWEGVDGTLVMNAVHDREELERRIEAAAPKQ